MGTVVLRFSSCYAWLGVMILKKITTCLNHIIIKLLIVYSYCEDHSLLSNKHPKTVVIIKDPINLIPICINALHILFYCHTSDKALF